MRQVAIKFKSACMQDADLLLAWRNDPETRRASRDESIISECDHILWMKGRLAMPNPDFWIAVYCDQPVGVVTRDNRDGAFELSWNVASKHRGQGFGKEMVSIIAAVTEGRVGAWVKSWNLGSAKIANYCGMEKKLTHGDLEYWERAD